MQVFVRTITGATLTVAVETDSTVEALRKQVAAKTQIPESEIVLIAGTATLEDELSLSEAGLVDESNVTMTLRLAGGKKKKKKKQYSTPKKIKHKHESKKMMVLDYFTVDKSGKITKNKQESTEFAGCYLADHHDRMHCGRTGNFMFYKLTKNGERLPPVQNKPKRATTVVVEKKKGKKK